MYRHMVMDQEAIMKLWKPIQSEEGYRRMRRRIATSVPPQRPNTMTEENNNVELEILPSSIEGKKKGLDLSTRTSQSSVSLMSQKQGQSATFQELYSQATPLDVLFMIIGTMSAMVVGFSVPFSNVIFGRILDLSSTNSDSFFDSITDFVLILIYLGIANLVGRFLQVTFWSISGERQSRKYRDAYVKAILSQEIGWFDQCGASELATRVADLNGKLRGTLRDYD